MIESFNRKRRGISEILASIVLIVMTVISGATLYAFVTGFFSSTATSMNANVEPSLLIPTGSNVATWSITIKNAGTVDIKSVIVNLYNGDALLSSINYSPKTLLAPGQETTILQIGNTVTSPSGATFSAITPSQTKPPSSRVTHTYLNDGNYTVTVIASDDNNKPGWGHRGVSYITITVTNNSSVLIATLTSSGDELIATTNQNISSTPYYLMIWQLSPNVQLVASTKTGTSLTATGLPNHGYLAFVEKYSVSKTTIKNLSNSYSYYVFLPPNSPLTVNVSATPTYGKAPLTVSFTAIANGGTGNYTYYWDFGDGTNSTTTPSGSDSSGTSSPSMPLTGSNIITGKTYNYQIIITFANGANKTITGSVTASPF